MPTSPTFVHLRLHSEYSIVDGIVRIDEAVSKAVTDGMPALALTDLSNLFGLVKFYQEAREKGIKPIIGCDVWISNEADRDKPVRILLLCQSYPGYLLLCRLLSRAYRENQHRGRAEIRKSWLKEGGMGTDGHAAAPRARRAVPGPLGRLRRHHQRLRPDVRGPAPRVPSAGRARHAQLDHRAGQMPPDPGGRTAARRRRRPTG